jgi:hypothetical protein
MEIGLGMLHFSRMVSMSVMQLLYLLSGCWLLHHVSKGMFIMLSNMIGKHFINLWSAWEKCISCLCLANNHLVFRIWKFIQYFLHSILHIQNSSDSNMKGWRTGVHFPAEVAIFCFTVTPIPAMGCTQLPVQSELQGIMSVKLINCVHIILKSAMNGALHLLLPMCLCGVGLGHRFSQIYLYVKNITSYLQN